MSCHEWLSDTQWQLLEADVEQCKLLGQVVVVGYLNTHKVQLKDHIAHDTFPDSMPTRVQCGYTHPNGITRFNAYGENLLD